MRTLAILLCLAAANVPFELAHAGGDSNPSSNGIVASLHTPTVAVSAKPQQKAEAASFSLKGLDGLNHSLGAWKGKVIVLNFWATWCSPCLYEISDFVAYQEKYKKQGLQFIGIGLDEEQKLRNVQRTLEINYPILIADPIRNGKLMESWGNKSGVVPYSVVIDRNGRIAFTLHGVMSSETFEENVLPLLAGA